MSYHKKLMGYLTTYEQNSIVYSELMRVIGDELYTLSSGLNDFIEQLFIDTATWGLDFWERNLNIPTQNNLSYEQRRKNIKAKLRGHGEVSDLMVEGVIEAIIGVVSDVTFGQDGIMRINFNGASANISSKELIDTLNAIKPAYYDYEFSMSDFDEFILDITTYEFWSFFDYTDGFTTTDYIYGKDHQGLNGIQSTTYEFVVLYGMTDMFMTAPEKGSV